MSFAASMLKIWDLRELWRGVGAKALKKCGVLLYIVITWITTTKSFRNSEVIGYLVWVHTTTKLIKKIFLQILREKTFFWHIVIFSHLWRKLKILLDFLANIFNKKKKKKKKKSVGNMNKRTSNKCDHNRYIFLKVKIYLPVSIQIYGCWNRKWWAIIGYRPLFAALLQILFCWFLNLYESMLEQISFSCGRFPP